MKIKCLSLSIILLLIYSQTQAQNETLSVSVSEKMNSPLGVGILNIVGETDEDYFMLKVKNQGFVFMLIPIATKHHLRLAKVNKKTLKEETLKIEGIYGTAMNGHSKRCFEFMVQDKNETLWLFYSEKTKDGNYLYKKQLDADSFTFKAPELVSKQSAEGDRRDSYKMISSQDKSHFALFSFTGKKNSKTSKIYAEIFDGQLNSKWKFDESVEKIREDGYSNNLVSESESTYLTNKGEFFVLGRGYSKDKKKSRYALYCFLGDKKLEIIPFTVNDKHILQVKMKADKNDQIKIFGTYANTVKATTMEGFLYQMVNTSTLEFQNVKYIPFTNELKKAFLSSKTDQEFKKMLDKGKAEVSTGNRIIDVFEHANSSFTIITEHYDWSTHVTSYNTAGGQTRTSTRSTYKYGHLTFTNISQAGEINWIKPFDKLQVVNTPHIAGTANLLIEDSILFIFTDLKARTLKYGKINSSGEVVSKKLIEKKDWKGYYFVPHLTQPERNGAFLGLSLKGFNYKFLKFSYN